MYKEKDITVKNEAGLYLMKRADGTVGLTNKANATHYSSKRSAKKDARESGHRDLSLFIKFTGKSTVKKIKIKQGV